MAFIEENIAPDEEIQAQITISVMSQIGHILLGFICLLAIFFWAPAAIFGVILWVWAYCNLNANELAITNKQVIGKIGLISREVINLPLLRIESIDLDQSILGRVFNYGTITVSGSGGHMISIPFVVNPLEFRRMFMKIINDHSEMFKKQAYTQNLLQ